MKPLKIAWVWSFFGLFLVLHLLCHFLHLYDKIWWSDKVVHCVAGLTAGLLWWWIVDNKSKLSNAPASVSKTLAWSIIAFSTTISTFWEWWEYSNWHYDFLRKTTGLLEQQYYPYLGNNLGDIFWGFIGGCIVAVFYILCNKRKTA
jgi:hypothetical protein